VNFGERGKSSGRRSLTSTVKPVLTGPLAKGWLRVCVDLVKGSIGVHWRGFRGDDPGWPRFDRCLTGLTWLIRSLALMTVIKNLGRHSLPPLRRISSRDSKFQGQIEKKGSGPLGSSGITLREQHDGIMGKSIPPIGSRLARKSSQRRQVMGSFCTEFTWDASRKYGEINWYRIFWTILLTRYLVCNLMWHGCATTMQCFSKSDVMHMFTKTRCTYSCSRCLWCMLAWLGYPQNEIAIERTITSWEGVCVASRILTIKIPSAPLVAIMWLQRTWHPWFRHGTFSYEITTSPNTKDRVEDIGNTPCICTLVHPRFPNAHAMHMHAQGGT
jgi:hypothetical protein